MSTPKILFVVTGTDRFAGRDLKTGLWLSELTHIYDSALKREYDSTIASPQGGNVPIDPESLKTLMLDKLSKDYWEVPEFREKLQHVPSLGEIAEEEFDCIYLAGGHGAMYDFPDNIILQSIIRKHYENRKIVAAICHGVCGLLNVGLSTGEYLIKNKKLTGFSWFEEGLAGRKDEVPFNLEEELKKRGADYEKALIPMTSKVVVDGNLITGQDPFSSEEMAEVVIKHLEVKV